MDLVEVVRVGMPLLAKAATSAKIVETAAHWAPEFDSVPLNVPLPH